MNPEILTARNWYMWLWLSPLLTIPTLLFILQSIDPGFQLICGGDYRNCDYNLAFQVSWVIGILASAVWHLILIVPILNKHSEFVRWHGRQALLMAGMRTAIPLAVGFILFSRGGYIADELWLIPLMIAVWLGGTLWGQLQASRGDCALMRWTGHGAGLPLPTGMAKPAGVTPPAGEPVDPIAACLNTIRFSPDAGERERAVQALWAALPAGSRPVVASFGGSGMQDQDAASSARIATLVEIIRSNRDLEQRREALSQLEKLGMVEK